MRHLIAACPHIARAHEIVGTPEPRDRETGFATLLRIIVDQQVSVQAGAAIWRKLENGVGVCTPEGVLAAGDEKLRTFGLSKPKARYAICLADAITSGGLDLAGLEQMDDGEVRTRLTAITGIGNWTAEIYLMFALGRSDVWPSGDLALAEAARRLLGLDARPTPEQLTQIAERWRPERTAAALFLWHCYKKLPIQS